jgi:hypothetical protein
MQRIEYINVFFLITIYMYFYKPTIKTDWTFYIKTNINYYDFKISNVIIDILALSVNIAISNFKKIYHRFLRVATDETNKTIKEKH